MAAEQLCRPLSLYLSLSPALQLFKGKFYHCEGLDTKNVTNKSDCLQANYRWIRRKYNFDNLVQVRINRLRVRKWGQGGRLAFRPTLAWAQTRDSTHSN